MNGIFTISLDFELHWGVFDKRNRDQREACYKNTLAIIPQMLEMFAEHDVHVTWATVGSLFANDEKEWKAMQPAEKPDYLLSQYSAYKWAEQNGVEEKYRWAHFAPESVASILKYPGQELGTHTFAHYYCLEENKNKDAFEADLEAAKKASLKYGHSPLSLVFPRNQFNPENLHACIKQGIKVVRTNPSTWFWTPVKNEDGKLARKLFRTGDAYLPVSNRRSSYPLKSISKQADQPIQLPASRLLRPWHPKYNVLNKLALARINNELTTAAKNKECYHLWWHPENFGDYPSENLNNLAEILTTYKSCVGKYGMSSWNMGEYYSNL